MCEPSHSEHEGRNPDSTLGVSQRKRAEDLLTNFLVILQHGSLRATVYLSDLSLAKSLLMEFMMVDIMSLSGNRRIASVFVSNLR